MKTTTRNAYSAAVPTATQEARPLENEEGSGGHTPNPALLGEPKSMQQLEIDDFTFAGERPWRDEDVLRGLYLERGLTQQEVAEVLGCSQRTVCVHLAENGISARRSVKPSPDGLGNEAELRRLYEKGGKTTREIAELYSCSKSTVNRWLAKYGIERHYPAENPPAEELQDRELLYGLYIERGLTSDEIADLLGYSNPTILKYLHLAGVEVGPMMAGLSGEDHWNWKGGHSKWYGANWRSQRRKALRRDNGQCSRCGMSMPEHLDRYDEELHVHHIIRKDDFDDLVEANRLANLITLCASCHGEIEGLPIDNRDRERHAAAEAREVTR